MFDFYCLFYWIKHTSTSCFLFSDENYLSMTTNHKPLSIVAKCGLCSIKTELFVCSHCDEVICQKCVDKHQVKQSETLKEQWNLSKTKYLHLCRLSGLRTNKFLCFFHNNSSL
jgi:hypothetical protein